MLLSKRKFQLLQQMFKVPYRPSNQKYNSEEIELIKFSNYLSKHLYNNSSTILTPSHRKSSLKDVTIEIVGVVTNICVISNALLLRAINNKRKIVILSDLCAGTTPENHNKALDIMKMNLIEVKESNEVLSK